MSDRYFENFMSEFVEEKATLPGATDTDQKQDSLTNLLSLPYPTLAEKLKRPALDLKETVVVETWGFTGQKVEDVSVYTGTLGTALLLLKSYQVTNNKSDLNLCSEIIKVCDLGPSNPRVVSFLLGRAGVCAVGAVVANYQGDQKMVHRYLTQFKQINVTDDFQDEMIGGKAGYLWACLFLNKHLGHETIPSTHTSAIVDKIIENGRKLGSKEGGCPLMYESNGKRYWGVAHGLAGIMHALMHFELKPDARADVKNTLKYMINNRFPSGNYPRDEDDKSDELVYWCHGAPGVALTLVKAAEVFEDKEMIKAATEAAEVVWRRGLLKKVGLCHGISGNAYVFLSIYRMTGRVEYLHKAKAFACFLLDRGHKLMAEGQMHGGDTPPCLKEWVGWLICFWT